jgi:S-DNA-T family DNA segregation ATPase FtsK/SpoIIIE
MKITGLLSDRQRREAKALLCLLVALVVFPSLVSYNPFDPSLNTVVEGFAPHNLMGRVGALIADFLLQSMGYGTYLLPTLILLAGWKWVRGLPLESARVRAVGGLLWVAATSTALGLIPSWTPIGGAVPAGGFFGSLIAGFLITSMNISGAILLTSAWWLLSLYLVFSGFELAKLPGWVRAPFLWVRGAMARIVTWRERKAEEARAEEAERAARRAAWRQAVEGMTAPEAASPEPPIIDPLEEPKRGRTRVAAASVAPKPVATAPSEAVPETVEDIPIREYEPPPPPEMIGPKVDPEPAAARSAPARHRTEFQLPPTNLLQEPAARAAWDSAELKETAALIKSKFEEFNVRGSVTQINPGPVVTTFEFKPEAGVKYSRITTLTEDLCLGLQAESILIERIPGKPTVGIEVPNSKREVISLRQILESDEFAHSASPLTVAMGKDINGRIKVAALDTMPHLLVAGSTGSGKSVMLNSLIMSVLYKSTPHEVRMILVDPKRLEFGLYEGIPHLLTPVITDPKKATNALRNAVLEMERRLKLLASVGVRNIEQYNKKIRQLRAQPRSLFTEDAGEEEELETIPYVLILIDELADLMMLERANVEESVMRLAQMARAVGMHLVLATQRPSVDVITGVIKANFPSRISFRVATRVDSRTVLDVMGAEHLLGKGDMLFLPPGSSRLVRVHGSYVSEAETNSVVEFWKKQAEPEYDQSFLIAPPSEDEDDAAGLGGPEDPMYQEAVRVVCEMGKASTSTLQRRLRLGYGRAARILDRMQRDGIIGPPDGSRPRDVLKTPDWLYVENQLR